MEKQKKDVRINIKLTKEDRKKFKDYCLNQNTVISKRIRKLIEMDLNGKISE